MNDATRERLDAMYDAPPRTLVDIGTDTTGEAGFRTYLKTEPFTGYPKGVFVRVTWTENDADDAATVYAPVDRAELDKYAGGDRLS